MTLHREPEPITDEVAELTLTNALDELSLARIFVEARSANAFIDRAVSHQLLERALELALLGPTSANSQPLRVVFVESREAKEKLKPALSEGNRDKTMAAPVTAVVATDVKFVEHFPRLFPERGEMLKSKFGGMPEPAQRGTAWDNALLQTAYFIIALRSVGLDAGPMAGFERSVVDNAFLATVPRCFRDCRAFVRAMWRNTHNARSQRLSSIGSKRFWGRDDLPRCSILRTLERCEAIRTVEWQDRRRRYERLSGCSGRARRSLIFRIVSAAFVGARVVKASNHLPAEQLGMNPESRDSSAIAATPTTMSAIPVSVSAIGTT